MKRTTLTGLALVAALLAGCAGGSGNEDDGPAARESVEQAQAQAGKAKRRAARSRRKKPARARRAEAAAKAPARRRPPGPAVAAGSGPGTARPSRPPRAPRRPRARLFPAAGVYRYRQAGYEDFCQAASCRREQLPQTQLIALRVLQSSGDGATLASEERGSPYRSVHSRWLYTSRNALITRVSFRVSYRGLGYSRVYRPRPAITSLRFPLRAGRQWAGRWAAQTSGSYSARVVEVAPVTAAGRTIRAAKVMTTTYLRGELRGRADLTAWIDPRTRAIVQTLGRLDVTSSFGRYVSEFHTLLASAPGY